MRLVEAYRNGQPPLAGRQGSHPPPTVAVSRTHDGLGSTRCASARGAAALTQARANRRVQRHGSLTRERNRWVRRSRSCISQTMLTLASTAASRAVVRMPSCRRVAEPGRVEVAAAVGRAGGRVHRREPALGVTEIAIRGSVLRGIEALRRHGRCEEVPARSCSVAALGVGIESDRPIAPVVRDLGVPAAALRRPGADVALADRSDRGSYRRAA